MKHINPFFLQAIVYLLMMFGHNLAFTQTNFWEQTGFTNTSVWYLAINPDDDIFAATPDGMFRSTDDGNSWCPINTGSTYIVHTIVINSSGYIFAGSGGLSGEVEVFRSTDNGDNWTQTDTGLTGSLRTLAINISNGHIFAGASQGLFHSTDNGDNWVLTSFSHDVDVVAINSSGHIFVGTELDGIFRSTDNGDNWEAINSGLPGGPIFSIGIDPSSDHIFITSFGTTSYEKILSRARKYKLPLILVHQQIFRSTDNGDSWTNVTGGIMYFYAFSWAFNSSGHIFAGIHGFCEACDPNDSVGMFRSTDGGDSWTAINAGLTSLNLFSLAVSSSDYIFAGTHEMGVFRSVQTTTSVEEITGEVPTSFFLQQNFPNPFNPTTVIRYKIAKVSDVELTIYNQLGQEVRTLVKERRPAGAYQIEWNGRDNKSKHVVSGVYLYRLRAGSFIQTRKMVLLR